MNFWWIFQAHNQWITAQLNIFIHGSILHMFIHLIYCDILVLNFKSLDIQINK